MIWGNLHINVSFSCVPREGDTGPRVWWVVVKVPHREPCQGLKDLASGKPSQVEASVREGGTSGVVQSGPLPCLPDVSSGWLPTPSTTPWPGFSPPTEGDFPSL